MNNEGLNPKTPKILQKYQSGILKPKIRDFPIDKQVILNFHNNKSKEGFESLLLKNRMINE